MDPGSATAPSSLATTWRRSVRRRSLGEARVQEAAAEAPGRRVEELEEAVGRLRAEKEAAERAVAALRAELDAERGAAETAASEAMLMIARLQSDKAAALIEAREFRRLAEGRAGRDRELQDELAAVSALAELYAALLRAHGIDPDDDEESAVELVVAEAGGVSHGGNTEAKGPVVEEPSPLPPPPPAAQEFEYTVDVPCSAAAALVGKERAVDAAGCLSLYARVDALEAHSAVVRREFAALRAERAQVALAREVVRQLCWCREGAAARAVVVAAERPRFSVLAICKWFFSTMLWGKTGSTSAASSSTTFLLGQHLLLERSKGDHRMQSQSIRPWCSPL
ncbi:uncharacterized protein LOC133893352 [Phragmites australis]|uniref:uncharacterized protein LOC133893352 n=1 Tax=Phragmites australis TaxID=29695 RepID=UPI002D781D4E|nr:uncharacterized protein LOC133893352 [Phragmites australis]